MNAPALPPLLRVLLAVALWSGVVSVVLPGCQAATPPPRYQVLHLHGTPYQRGLQHGQQLRSQIRSFYTRMLATSLLPYLNRQQHDIAAVLKTYAGPDYANGQFSTLLLRESAASLQASIPQPYLDEMHGIADGSGMTFQDILVLNTFLDTTLAARGITYFLQQLQAPQLMQIQWLGANQDGRDNDDDGTTDEANEGVLDYGADVTATLVELDPHAKLVLRLGDDDGVDAATVRLLVDGKVYTQGSPGLVVVPWPEKGGPSATDLRVEFQPPQPLDPAKPVSFLVQASDRKLSVEPPPAHAHAMRPEQFTITTQGAGLHRWQVPNRGVSDGNSQPPAHGFALRKTATLDGKPLLAHHFSLLDAGVAHDHALVQIHHPESGPDFAMIGWAGLVYGLSGMNGRGLAIAVDHSDTLNNPLTDQFRKLLFNAKLMSAGTPIGIAGRIVLEQAGTAQEGAALLQKLPHSFGWNVLLADAAGDLRVVEAHSDILGEQPPAVYTPNPQDPGSSDGHGQPWASVGPDDLRMAAHFRKNAEDLEISVGYDVRPQRFWSSYFFPSVRVMADMGDEIVKGYGKFDLQRAIAVLRQPGMVDRNDSMTATVFQPADHTFHAAIGQVPATDAPFDTFTLPRWP